MTPKVQPALTKNTTWTGMVYIRYVLPLQVNLAVTSTGTKTLGKVTLGSLLSETL